MDVCVRLVVVLSLMGVLFSPRPEHRRAYRPEIEVLDHSPDQCTAAVGGSKVALLFLTRGHLHHEPSWKLCLEEGSPDLEAARTVCNVQFDPEHLNDVIAYQHLFSVYVHLSAEIDPGAVGPLWRSRLVQHRVPTEWGTHSLVEATRSLLWEAFKDPSNQRFVLVSEADIPIWDPLTFYHELMAEQRSRVDAWWHPDMDADRWSWRMALSGARIRKTDWRKSAQWFSLLRSHVQLTLQDEVVFTAFEDHCRSAFDGDYGRWRDCYSDEHYLPTLLHMKGLQEETVPSPLGITAADWSKKSPHPHEYAAEEVVPELFTTRLRNNSDCPTVSGQHAAVQEAARKNFVTISSVLGNGAGQLRSMLCTATSNTLHNMNPNREENLEDEVRNGDHSSLPVAASGPSFMKPRQGLPSGCSLLARKFSPASAEAVMLVFQNCTSGLMLIGDAECKLHEKEREVAAASTFVSTAGVEDDSPTAIAAAAGTRTITNDEWR
ncbi:hypothetical protein KSW81_001016 [Nannochloris sp. 'desiccata']|nr:hypothetical protein KSW81_001016 [Chlorella desiccata (nom. nud.)]